MTSSQHLTLHFANSAEEAPRIARRIEYYLHDKKISDSIINKILLCVDELITNIIAHAYTDKQEHAVLLDCKVVDNVIELELRDDGVPFDPTTQTRPDVKLSLENRDIGGLGIHLVMTLMDKVEYQREGDFNVLKARISTNSRG
ncbi:ATP-binding protein [Candidatus Berkiella aquae]|uniref:ATP-binding protein n=1 Tax=Candidatus Berkiella aquae TaxID=295108 RepID=A0A0Q9YRV3_9GAMM|nr:ATP-binding protein [Candidatus Berkiella aquae]MCS5712002.1 ATP-binding protein [Candidatus Berkiella aquae]